MSKLSVTVNFRTRPEYKQALEKIADKEDLSVSDIVNRMVREALQKSGYVKVE